MSLHQLAPRPLATERSPWLRGVMRMPGDRAISHRALILGAMARGETIVEGLHESADVFATGRAMQALGARIDKRGPRWHIMGIGVGGFHEPEDVLHFSSSTVALRLCMGLIGPYGFTSHYVGDPALAGRSQAGVLAALQHFGVGVVAGDGAHLPFSLRGARLATPADLVMEAPSALLKSAMLLGALAIPGVTKLTEPLPTRDHTERMLRTFGARLDVNSTPEGGQVIEIEGLANLRAQQVVIGGDASAAGHAIVAGLTVPSSELLIEKVLVSPMRTGLIDTLREMGAQIDLVQPRKVSGEDVADVRVIQSGLRGVTVPAARMPALVEEFPLLCVAAAMAEGETVINGLSALRDRDCDQLQAVANALAVNRVTAQVGEDSVTIHGTGKVKGGGRVVTHGDAAMAMAFLVLGMAADEQVTVDDQSAIAQIYPGFIQDFEAIGASFLRYT
jgi:3-phosphoshikimate 1-carboxyvinyltransferase